jgi:hypothetical protein
MSEKTSNTNPALQIVLGVFSIAVLTQIGMLGYQLGQWIKAH